MVNAGTLDTVGNIMIVICVIMGIAVIVIYARIFIRKYGKGNGKGKGKKGSASAQSVTKKTAKAADFIPVEKIANRMVKMEGEDRYVASVNCRGFDFISASKGEKARAMISYRSFINTIREPVTLRVDSTAVDLSSYTKEFEKSLERYEQKAAELMDDFVNRGKQFNSCTDAEQRDRIGREMNLIEYKLSAAKNQIAHCKHIIAYQNELSGRDANPILEQRYIFDCTFDPLQYPADFSREDMEEQMVSELDGRISSSISALSSAYVNGTRDDDETLYELNYRHFHPFACDYYRKRPEDTNSETRIVSGEHDFARLEKEYTEAEHEKQFAEWRKELFAKEKKRRDAILAIRALQTEEVFTDKKGEGDETEHLQKQE